MFLFPIWDPKASFCSWILVFSKIEILCELSPESSLKISSRQCRFFSSLHLKSHPPLYPLPKSTSTPRLHSNNLLVYPGCCNRIPWIRWLTRQTFISHNSGGWELQDQGTSCFTLCWGLTSLFTEGYLFAVTSHAEETNNSLGVSYKGTNFIHKGSTLVT